MQEKSREATKEQDHDGFYYLDELSPEELTERMELAQQRMEEAGKEMCACRNRLGLG